MADTLTKTLFDEASLRSQIDKVFKDVPEGRHGALVGYYLLSGKWRVTMVHRIGGQWSFGATLGKDAAAAAIDGGIQVLGSW
jgi:hypothetical protein